MSSMVILDSDQIPHGISRKFVKFPGETQEHFYSRVTHLHHQNQKIYQIGDLSPVPNITVLYLYDNKLTKIEHLDAVPHLQMLYLQRNKITTLENLDHLTKLKKLYLSNNRINVIENLEELTSLQELHVDHQDLAPHQNVVFDPRSCSKLKKLRVLNASKNRMVDLKPLDLLTSLHQLDISHNLLEDLQSAMDSLSRIPALKVLDLRGNPLTSVLRYREHVIGACCYLNMIDGKPIDARSRLMMVNLAKMRQRTDSSSLSSQATSSSSEKSKERGQTPAAPPTFNVSCESPDEEEEEEGLLTTASSRSALHEEEDESSSRQSTSRGSESAASGNVINASELNFKNER